MMKVKGWAHICFLPPFDNKYNYESFQGHVVDEQTRKTYGLRGEWLDYQDPDRNDCMESHAFYRLVISDYSDHSIRSLVVRREMHDDFAALASHSQDSNHFDQADLSFYYQLNTVRTDEEAYRHCEKYLPKLIANSQKDNNVSDWLVTLGLVTFEDGSV